MKNDNELLAAMPVRKAFFRLALPAVAAQLINILYNLVDKMFIGHIPGVGKQALAGVGVTAPVILAISAFAALVRMGGAPKASIFMGKGDKESAERTLGNCFTTQIIVSLLLTIILFTGNRSFLMAFGASENTIPYAVAYMNIYSLGTIFVQLTLGMNAFITAQGFARTGMLSVLVGAASNIILDPVFIFVFHMGVRGAALATIISQALSCAWVLNFLTGKKSYLKIRRCNMKLQKNIILPSLALGLSTFIMQASESIISVCFNSSLLKYGGDLAVGAMTILTSAMQFAMLPLQGLGQGAQPIISYNFGAGQFDRVRQTIRRMIAITFTAAFVYVVFAMLRPALFAGLFTTDPELIVIVEKVLPVYIAGMAIFGLQSGVQSSFLGLGQAKISLFIALLRKVILLIPLALILPHFFGVMGVYYAEPIADVCSVITAVTLFLCNIRKILSTETIAKVTHTEE